MIAVLLDNRSNTFFYMIVGVHQGRPISPVLFNILLESITRETFHDHHDLHSICGRPVCPHADDITEDTNSEYQDLIIELTDSANVMECRENTDKVKVNCNNRKRSA